DTILIDDGLVGLKVTEIKDQDIICVVENSGIVKNHKGVNLPGVKINLPALTEKDISDIEFGIEQGIDFIAASFVRKASDVLAIREILENNNATHIQIISKIENQEGVENLDEILQVSDGLMVARGDLGVEVPTEEMPIIQKNMIKKCNELGKPVITATQMLDSMIRNPRPTRAEVTDVANAIYDGTDAIMLSGETAAGKYPVEAVKVMASIAKRIEETLDYEELLKASNLKSSTVTDAISYATCTTAVELNASAIVTSTSSGHTARMVSKFRPKTPIVAATDSDVTKRQLSLSWGVYAVKAPKASNTDEVVEYSIDASREAGYVKEGELVVITAGVPVGESGTTNLIKVHVMSEEIAHGMGVGRNSIEGKVKIVKNGEICHNFNDGDILVTSMTDSDMNQYIEKAGAIVTEEGGMTSHAAIVGINLGKPVVMSAVDIMNKVTDGEIVTVDALSGVVYRGSSRVL
ncbi:MAG: pyruvate kinase, partial [Intestinibacter sp.]